MDLLKMHSLFNNVEHSIARSVFFRGINIVLCNLRKMSEAIFVCPDGFWTDPQNNDIFTWRIWKDDGKEQGTFFPRWLGRKFCCP